MTVAVYPRFAAHEARAEDRSWLVRHHGQALRVEDVTDICATIGVSAELRDRPGVDARCVGRVDCRGQVEIYSADDIEDDAACVAEMRAEHEADSWRMAGDE